MANKHGMYIYNITIKVDWSIHDAWVDWMTGTEIPRMTGTVYFSSHQMLRLLEIDDADGPTYAIQYHTSLLNTYQTYEAEQMAADNAASYALWGQRCVFFTTLMEVVN